MRAGLRRKKVSRATTDIGRPSIPSGLRPAPSTGACVALPQRVPLTRFGRAPCLRPQCLGLATRANFSTGCCYVLTLVK